MTQNIVWFSIVIGLLVGCAERKYEIIQETPPLIYEDTLLDPNSNPLLNADCSLKFKNSDLCVLWAWDTLPTAQNAGVLYFKITRDNLLDASPLPIDISTLPSVILWMPSMSHGSTPTRVEHIDVGSFKATDVFFIMPGEWEIRFQIKEGEEILDEAILTLII